MYGARKLHHDTEQFMKSLLDNLSTKRIEIDMIRFNGIEFRHVDSRLMSLKLVELGLSNVAMFRPNGDVIQPTEALRKRPVLVERGSFRPVTKTNVDIMECAYEMFCKRSEVEQDQVIQVMELTMNNLMATGEVDHSDFLARADVLGACGYTVLISNYFEYYRLAEYLRKLTNRRIGVDVVIIFFYQNKIYLCPNFRGRLTHGIL